LFPQKLKIKWKNRKKKKKDIHPANHSFQKGAKLMAFQIGLFKCVEEIHVSLERNSCVVEKGSSSTLFPCGN
jgi:hypothetical protein